MLIKLLIVIVLIAILVALACGMFFLIRDKGRSQRSVKALTWRISLSLTLFFLIIIGYVLGIIKPHGLIPPTQQAAPVNSQPTDHVAAHETKCGA